MPTANTKFLRRADAADYLRETWGLPCSRGLLAKLAGNGAGPIFRSAGRYPLYAREDLDAWAKERISAPRRTTSRSSTTSVERKTGLSAGSSGDHEPGHPIRKPEVGS